MFLVFRDGAKTSILRAFTLQQVCYSISKTVMFVSASQDHSIHSLRWLKRQVKTTTLIYVLFICVREISGQMSG